VRKWNDAIKERHTAIEQYYKSHVAGLSCHPSFATFRTFPAVTLIIKSANTEGSANTNLSKPLRDLIQSNLTDWLDRTRNTIRRMLGYGDPFNKTGKGRMAEALIWRSQPGKLDPEMRPTALFECILCRDVASKYKRMGVLDFPGLCSHDCVEKHKTKKDRTLWSAGELLSAYGSIVALSLDEDNFMIASRARDAVKQMLEVAHKPEDEPSISTFLKDSASWICNKCPPNMRIMHYEDMVSAIIGSGFRGTQ